jgi:hypothetical protein
MGGRNRIQETGYEGWVGRDAMGEMGLDEKDRIEQKGLEGRDWKE